MVDMIVVYSEEAGNSKIDGATAGSHQCWWLRNLRVSYSRPSNGSENRNLTVFFEFNLALGKYATHMWHPLNRKLWAILWKDWNSTSFSSIIVSFQKMNPSVHSSLKFVFSFRSSTRQELQINQYVDSKPSHPFNGRGCGLHCLRPADSIRGQVSFDWSSVFPYIFGK